MTLEYLEIMEDVKKRKLQKSFKSNTRIYSDGSIEVDPQAQGEPSQKDVKKVGKSKRYITNGKNPLTCVELKCPEDVPDKAAFFHKELAKLTKDMEIEEPQMPDGEFLLNEPNVKVRLATKDQKVMAWLTFEAKGLEQFRALITAPETYRKVKEAREVLARGDKNAYDNKKKGLPFVIFIATYEEWDKKFEARKPHAGAVGAVSSIAD